MPEKLSAVVIELPKDFDFGQCLVYLGRSPKECLHRVCGDELYQAVCLNGRKVLLNIRVKNKKLQLEILSGLLDPEVFTAAGDYVRELFDLDRDLRPFYRMAPADPILNELVAAYRGLRLMQIPDLFEALAWAIIGQQINLSFAYTLKRRLVESFGEPCCSGEFDLWTFPTSEKIADLSPTDLTGLQFTGAKARYLIGLARQMAEGKLQKSGLMWKSPMEIETILREIPGVGEWTAHYVMMKSFGIPTAFPVTDAGLRQAIQNILGLAEKPTLEFIRYTAQNWKGWEAYAVFYLWRSLIKNSFPVHQLP